jgi:predicted DCC family thiol-disulfide oxidoreductase YuxK
MKSEFAIEMFYDGDCPLCVREQQLLHRLDRKQQIRFTDISAPEFDPSAAGKSLDDLMAEMHGRLPDGSWVTGVEVFRRLYSAVGLGLLVWPTRLPGVSHGLDLAYSVFARNRLKLTGRCDDRCTVPPAGVN